ncbi:MAG: hypothetical protein AMXMBFR64_56420 [Myxococcales bacterium]
MRLLLDTHVWLWMLSDPGRIQLDARRLLADDATVLFLSAASAWEIAIKYHLGKLSLPEPPRDFIPRRLVRDRVTPLPVEHHHAVEVAGLPSHHLDPFDRLLVAQALVEDLTLVTTDDKLTPYGARLLRA